MPDTPLAAPEEAARESRRWPVVALAVLGAVALAAGLTGLVLEVNREPAAEETVAAGPPEIATRWQRLPAGQMFPATVSHGQRANARTVALRSGIGTPADCTAAFDRPLADVLIRYGCRTVLRATYVDFSRTLVATVGVVPLADAESAPEAEIDIGTVTRARADEVPGLRFLPVPGTVTAGIAGTPRQLVSQRIQERTPYIVFYSAGWLDGRPRLSGDQAAWFDFADIVAGAVGRRFAPAATPCTSREVPC